jgi:hypothetical protein
MRRWLRPSPFYVWSALYFDEKDPRVHDCSSATLSCASGGQRTVTRHGYPRHV